MIAITHYDVGRRRSTLATERFAIDLAFLLLFPGFFFYQTLLGLGIIGAFLGGYFSLVSLALILPLLFFYLRNVRRYANYFATIDFYFFLFLAYFFCIVAINFFAGANINIVRGHVLTIIYFVNLFIIFRMIDATDDHFKVLAALSVVAMSAIVFYFSVSGSFYLALVGDPHNPESLSTYQGFARSYLFTFVIVVSFIRSITTRIFMYAIAIATLFLNTARSEFVAVIFLIPIIELYYARRKFYIVLAMLFVLALIGMNYETILQVLPENRVLELLDLSQASSAKLRHQLAVQALQTIRENPILGEYGSYIPGLYAHNILSAWIDLGLFGFIYLLAMLILPALQMLVGGYFLKRKSSSFLLACSFISITLLLSFTAKDFSDMSIAAAIGAYANYRYGRKHE